MLIVHGIAEHSGRYETTGSRLADHGIEVRSFDLIGWGATGGKRGDVESWTNYLDQVEDNLSQLDDDLPRVLLGHSMGGLLTLTYALSERPRPDALVLSAPALEGGAAWQRAAAPVLARLTPTLPVPQAIEGEELSRDPSVGEAYFADPLVYTKATARMGNELFQAMDRAITNLPGLEGPVLVIHGAEDTVVPPRSSAVLGTLPGVERRLLLGLRHEVFNEPEGPEIIDDVADWLRSTLS